MSDFAPIVFECEECCTRQVVEWDGEAQSLAVQCRACGHKHVLPTVKAVVKIRQLDLFNQPGQRAS